MTDATPPRRDDRRRKYVVAALGGVVVVVGVASILISFGNVDVCDQQLTDSGEVVRVCRHLQVTDPPIVAVGLVMLAALGCFFTEVGAFGISLKREVMSAKVAATDAREVADYASGAAQSAASVAQIAEQLAQQAVAPSRRLRGPKTTELDHEIRTLAEEYNAERKLPSGPARTARMTAVVGRMIALLADRTAADVDLPSLLASDDRGLRLAGYSYLYANPQPALTTALADTVIREDKPFGQYWGLRALRRQVETDPETLDLNTKRRLQELLSRVGPGTDRAHELRAILDTVSEGSD